MSTDRLHKGAATYISPVFTETVKKNSVASPCGDEAYQFKVPEILLDIHCCPWTFMLGFIP
ncbi:hypothetical protein PanWU01x14_303780 [Parasponia andersonii]|uniref:Uncharacterized protein n=1 Tax=Parasponia andersonii TaxID=3476 RepID=A0A2P5ASU0_PARAD|nr:hypothetical protein PanWU01x14_303780 [Parasponia andersonii]